MKAEKRVVAIVQARMGSSRLPGKVLKEILGRPLLGLLIERLKRCTRLNELVIATSMNELDDVIFGYCMRNGVAVYRGSENDVLSRYAEAARAFDADVVVRICADSPLIDPVLIDDLISEFLGGPISCDYISNTINQTYPLGMNAEVFSAEALADANINARLPYEREHVTPYIYGNPDRYNIREKHAEQDYSKIRLTVDVPEDFDLVKSVFESIYPNNTKFGLEDIISLYRDSPEMFDINAHVQQNRLPQVAGGNS